MATLIVKRRQRSQKPYDSASKDVKRGSLCCYNGRGSTDMPKEPGMEVPPGSESMANVNEGHPGTWEVSLPPFLRCRWGTGGTTPGLQDHRSVPVGGASGTDETKDGGMVLSSEGNEVRQNGQREVVAPS